MTAKHQKILAMAATKNGAPLDLYPNEAKELHERGAIIRGEKISAVGTRSLRWFMWSTATSTV